MIVFDWIFKNWLMIAAIVPIFLAFAYAIAKRTKTKKDDKIVKEAIGVWGEVVKFISDMRSAFTKPKENTKK